MVQIGQPKLVFSRLVLAQPERIATTKVATFHLPGILNGVRIERSEAGFGLHLIDFRRRIGLVAVVACLRHPAMSAAQWLIADITDTAVASDKKLSGAC